VVSCIGDSGVEAQELCIKSSDIARRDIPIRSGPSICRGHVEGIGDLVNSGVRKVNAQLFGVKSHETRGHKEAKWREAVSRTSEEDRCQRSRDLTNSGVRRLRAQTLGIPSREAAR
jgi:hypothetical protein